MGSVCKGCAKGGLVEWTKAEGLRVRSDWGVHNVHSVEQVRG